MQVRIHRGAHEIGGNCIEVAAGQDRIVSTSDARSPQDGTTSCRSRT